ncbi:MAG: hypothetical protein R3A79_31325 [Nannocystaceae bacterium]
MLLEAYSADGSAVRSALVGDDAEAGVTGPQRRYKRYVELARREERRLSIAPRDRSFARIRATKK